MPQSVVYGFTESLNPEEQAAEENVEILDDLVVENNDEDYLVEENLNIVENTAEEENATIETKEQEVVNITNEIDNIVENITNEVVVNNEVSENVVINEIENEVVLNVVNEANEVITENEIVTDTVNQNVITNIVEENTAEKEEINVQEFINIEGNILWDDNNDLEGKRPEKVFVNLLKNDIVYRFAEIVPDENGKWNFKFESLEKYDENGNEIFYSVSETEISNYEYVLTDGVNILNKFVPDVEVISKTITTIWKDNNGKYNTRPISVVVNLLKNNEKFQTVELSSDVNGNWNYTFDNLEKYDANGNENIYTVNQEEIDGYETVVNADGNIENTLESEFDLNISIKWNDDENKDLSRPENIVVNILNSENIVEKISIMSNEDGNWNYTYDNLDMYDANGILIDYSVSVDDITGYETVINKLNDSEIEITNNKIYTAEIDLTWEELLEVGPYIAMIVKLANDAGEELTAEEQVIYEAYRDLIFVRGAELASVALINGTEGFTEEELAIYTRYQEVILNGGELAKSIETLDIEVKGDSYNSKEILSVVRSDGAYYRYIVVNGGAVNNSLKYVASSDGAKPKNGDRVAYCMNYDRSFRTDNVYDGNAWAEKVNDAVYGKVFKKLYSELSYVVSIGCKTYGGTSNSGYSTADFIKNYDSSATAKWQEDYYVTQTVIYIILYDYTHNIDSILKTIDFTDAELVAIDKTELVNQISAIFSGHSSNITANTDETNSAYAGAHQSAVIDAVKAMYAAAKEYRKDSNSSESDGYDASISMTASSKKLKYEDGVYKVTVTVETVGDLVGDITFSGATGMSWVKNGDNKYTISIPATSVTNVETVTITAKAKFNKVKTVTYICADSTKQNIAFLQDEGKSATEQSVTLDVTKPTTVKISGIKTWVDDDNSQKTRPTSITVNLLANGVKVDSKTVTADNGWSYEFSGHAKKDSSGNVIKYTVEEAKVPSGYEESVSGYNIQNKLTGTVKVSGTKTWVDNNNAYNTRPDSINVEIYKSVKGSSESLATTVVVKPDSNNNWNYSTDLPKYDENGAIITYTIKEANVLKYESKVDGYNLVNTLNENVNITGTKTWKDENNSYNTRPESITVRLYKNNSLTAIQSITVTPDANGDWNYEFNELPKYDNGVLNVYKVVEDTVTNYKSENDITNAYNLVNTLTGKVTILGEKVWKDNDNAYGTRPDLIVVNLYKNNETDIFKTLTVYPNRLNKWTYEFSDLEKYDENGKLIEYSIKEVEVEGYKSENDTTNSYNLINTLTGETEAKVTKKWIDNSNAYGTRPESIIVKLLANGEIISSYEVKEDNEGNWEYEFKRLPKYDANGILISYTFDEEYVDSYEKNIDESLLTNKLVGKTDVKITKIWKDNGNAYETRPDSITVNLFKNNETEVLKTATIIPDALGNWSYTFENLDKYDDDGVLITYTVTEDSVTNYVLSAEKVNDYEYIFINTLTGKTEYEGTKFWKDNNNLYGTRPNSIIVNLLANGNLLETKEVTKDENGKWKYIFENLVKYDEEGVLITYTIEEEDIPNYVSKLENSNLINRLYDTIDVSGNKIWVDKDNTYKTRPEYIVVELLANGVKVAEKEVREDENGEWKFCFENVDKYDEDGVEYVYTLNEQPVMGYETHINSWTNTIYNILNYKEEENNNATLDQTPKTGRKNWLKVFISTAIASLLALFGIGKRKLLGEGK